MRPVDGGVVASTVHGTTGGVGDPVSVPVVGTESCAPDPGRLRREPGTRPEAASRAEGRPRPTGDYPDLLDLVRAAADGIGIGGVACQAARVASERLGGCAAAVFRLEVPHPVMVGYWSDASQPDVGAISRLGPTVLAAVIASGRPQLSGGVAAVPIMVGRTLWGAILLGCPDPRVLGHAGVAGLTPIGTAIGLAVTGASDHARARGWAPDPLTGLTGPQAMRAHVAREVTRARRHGLSVQLVMISIDGAATTGSDRAPAGADAVRWVAECLRGVAREDDIIARVGRDAFAWLLSMGDRDGAVRAAERLRAAVSRRVDPAAGRVSVSIGVCDLVRGYDHERLVAMAQAACADAQRAGGNAVVTHRDPAEGRSGDGSSGGTAASGGLAQVYALSRLVDTMDPTTHGHSRRVADLAGRLAEVLGWSGSQVRLLREAGLLYDVGKSGIPDEILLKTDALNPSEHELMRTHADLGARIIRDVLLDEQVTWVRHHHERWDGHGYPDGLAGDQIPDGARILAVADCWDAMTTGRPYRSAMSPEDALGECRAQAGTQFCPEVVAALCRLWDRGAVPGNPAG